MTAGLRRARLLWRVQTPSAMTETARATPEPKKRRLAASQAPTPVATMAATSQGVAEQTRGTSSATKTRLLGFLTHSGPIPLPDAWRWGRQGQ